MTPTRHDENGADSAQATRLDRGVVGITAVAGVMVALAVALASLAWNSIRGELGETRAALRELAGEVKSLRGDMAAAETARVRVEERVESLRDRARKEKP